MRGGIAPAWGLERAVVLLFSVALLWGGAAFALTLAAAPGLAGFYVLLAGGALLHLVAGGLYVWRRIVTTEYVVTEEFVYARRGRFLLYLGAAALDRLTDLHVHQGVLGRLFGFASLRVLTAGGGIHLPGLVDAVAVRGQVQEARQALLARLIREAGRIPAAPASGPPCQCPRCQHVFAAPGPAPVDVRCPSCGAEGTLFEEAAN